MTPRPRGYVGKNHETIGSDIIAVVRSLKMPDLTLGKEMFDQLSPVAPDGWYPIGWLLESMEIIDKRLGANGLRQMGRLLFELSHEARVGPKCAKDVIYGIDGMYHHANRGEQIGGWRVVDFRLGHAELDKTTPHHCAMEEGILGAALAAVGVPATIAQRQCFRSGADSCVYVVTSTITDERWAPPA